MVLHYDKKGKFLNQIGKRGEGAEDISSSNGIGIDDKNHEGKLENAPSNQWFAFSPVLNRYRDNINFMFDSNDTIYQYLETKKALKPRYILHCGERPTFKDIRTLNKEPEYFKYTFITDILESKNFLYFVAEKDRFAYLLRVDKKTGATHTIRQEDEIIISPIMKVRHRKITVPGFTNDLCGGLPFFPNSQDNKQWIAAFDAPDILEKIDIEQLKKSDVLLPEKRDQLVRILENLNEDDDPVIILPAKISIFAFPSDLRKYGSLVYYPTRSRRSKNKTSQFAAIAFGSNGRM